MSREVQPSPYAETARLRLEHARLRLELGAVLEWSRALRWHTLAACSRIRPIRGGADEGAFVVQTITGAPLCGDCISRKTGLTAAQIESILVRVGATISIAADTRRCAACLAVKRTYALNGAGPDAPARPRTTQRAILDYLGEHAGAAFCASCVSAALFAGKDIDVAMRHLEGSGVLRRHGKCATCGRMRLVASVPGRN